VLLGRFLNLNREKTLETSRKSVFIRFLRPENINFIIREKKQISFLNGTRSFNSRLIRKFHITIIYFETRQK